MTALLYKFNVIELGKDKFEMGLKEYVMVVSPIGFFQATTLAAGNTAYFYLSLSFLQMCKAMGPVVLFALLTGMGLDRFNTRVFLSILVIVVGTLMAAWGDVSFTAVGFTCILVAELSEAAKSAWMQFLLANKSFSMWEGLYFISPASLFFLFVASAALEFQDMVDKDNMTSVMFLLINTIDTKYLKLYLIGRESFRLTYNNEIISHYQSMNFSLLPDRGE